ncbi:invasion regulator SirB2 [Cronobacter turicensis]|uniref:invasion regulator SirB2 n=1 Tax=Cronobacter turicensis TaxID=413502 RepID=UPI001375BEE9|nr:invasion regulator SirB2 [Cronobacter turicensis]MEB8537765.1 invasion regulator SirB2 [Cronobacter sakazakii]EKM0525360.1 SirB family protein [Cronobacter turicensis]ELQ5999704.1 SirB family protein [Cronobacter turicensis]ELQ6129001.1 SirB family protein [Cronobacter turicensis]ELY3551997.1 SirB family protein [Cronobacter turicensis]
MAAYFAVKHLHILTVVISISLFILRYWWQYRNSPMSSKRWVRIVPHVNDTVLLGSGVALVLITHFYPFTPQGAWLTEKLFGVIIYIVLGFIALGRRPRSQQVRWIAFLLGLVVLYIIVKLATTKIPLLGLI